MFKKYSPGRLGEVFSLSLLFVLLTITNASFVNARQNSPINKKEGPTTSTYQFKLHMARGQLSFSEGYYDTAIKNFKKAMDLTPDSTEARSRYTQAILYKKLGVVMESTESG